MRKMLAVALQRAAVQSLEHARFGRWTDVDPAKELGDGASAASSYPSHRPTNQSLREVFGSKRSNSQRSPSQRSNSQRSNNSQRSTSQRSNNSQRSTASNRPPTPALDKATPFREYVWRGGVLLATKRSYESPRRMQPASPAPPLEEPPASDVVTTSSIAPVPMQTRYVGGRLQPTYQGSTFTLPTACSSCSTRAPVTTAEVLRSANGRRNTAFWVTTRRGPLVAPAEVPVDTETRQQSDAGAAASAL